ncbi:MAG: family 1 extracellular solute-binding protein [Paenibacillus sp.]|jgi:multiple sugar transport system substrate-binding protein|nr:family 1 extracellular solute-binding protein [Paenibacillus sp.]
MRKAQTIFIGFMAAVTLVGCGKSGGGAGENKTADKPPAMDNSPVTLKIIVPPYADKNFVQYVEAPVKQKYPHITFEKIASNDPEKVLVSGEKPDLFILGQDKLPQMKDLGILDNMDTLIRSYQMDTSRFVPMYLEQLKKATGETYLSALPIFTGFSMLYYNKDIFDRFGVGYPKDGITWEEATELAKKLTRQEQGVQYRGLMSVSGPQIPAGQLELRFFDDKLNPAVNNDGWKGVLEMMANIYKIPGNEQIVFDNAATDQFVKEQRVAMFAAANLFDQLNAAQGLNWDMVTYPVHKQAPKNGIEALPIAIGVTSMSKHKEAAFQVVATAVSDEVQMEMSKNTVITVLQDKKIEAAFGSNYTFLKDKNVQAVFKLNRVNGYNNYGAAGIMITKLNEIVAGKDVNTALREADELLVKHMEKLNLKK